MERLYGRHAVHECLRARRRQISKLWLADGVDPAPILEQISALARAQKVPMAPAPRERFDQVSPHAQGVLLEVSEYPYVDLEAMLVQDDGAQEHAKERAQDRAQEAPLILILDSLQDPQNFGNLMRAAEAVGVSGLVIPERRSASITPAVVNASAGATEHLKIARVVNLARAVEVLKKHEVWVAALQGDARSQEIYRVNLKGPLALIVGSEGEGVSRLLRDKADYLVKLPMHGQIESLNAAVAGAVALYEIVRQRGS